MVTFDSTDLDNAVSESGVVHQNTSNTDHTNDSLLKQGYDYASFSEITPTPLACYPLHEDSGSTVYDLAGTNDGTINGTTVGVTGLLGTTAHSLDGVDDNNVLGDVYGTPENGYTISAWIKPDSVSSGLGDWVAAENSTSWTLLVQQNDAKVRVFHQDTSSASFNGHATGDVLTAGNWHYVVVLWDGSQVEIYVDGVQELGPTSLLAPSSETNNWVMGYQPADNADYFAGDMADTRIYGIPISGAEQQTLYDVVNTAGSLTTQYKAL